MIAQHKCKNLEKTDMPSTITGTKSIYTVSLCPGARKVKERMNGGTDVQKRI